MRKIIYTLIILSVCLVGFVVWLKNPQLATLNFYYGLRWEGPVSIMVGVAFGCGVLIGWLFSLAGRLKTGFRLSKAKRENRQAERKIEQLKHAPAVVSSSRQIAA